MEVDAKSALFTNGQKLSVEIVFVKIQQHKYLLTWEILADWCCFQSRWVFKYMVYIDFIDVLSLLYLLVMSMF